MEASELRIGNLVLDTFGKVVEVKDIMTFGINSQWGYSTFNYEELKPIPLTEEWLLKFGLKQSTTDKKRFYILGTDIYIFNESKIFFNAGSSNLSIQLYYVHQLQNLYFALTNEELTYEQQK